MSSTCSYSWVSFIVLLPFISMTSTASTNHSNKARFCQQSTNVILQLLQIFQIKLMCWTVVITFQALAVAGSDKCMIGFSLLIHSNIFLSSFRTVLLVKLLYTKSTAFSSFDLWGVARLHSTWQPVKHWSNHSFSKKNSTKQWACLHHLHARYTSYWIFFLSQHVRDVKKFIRG